MTKPLCSESGRNLIVAGKLVVNVERKMTHWGNTRLSFSSSSKLNFKQIALLNVSAKSSLRVVTSGLYCEVSCLFTVQQLLDER